jgi:hypothetical protein
MHFSNLIHSKKKKRSLTLMMPYDHLGAEESLGGSHDQADAEWIVIRT